MFSVPLNPKLTDEELIDFIEFLEKYSKYVYDFYFTARIPPFVQDAMGDVFYGSQDDHNYLIQLALNIQNHYGIKASAVFNNIEVRASQQNLDLFIKNFRPMYEAGIRSVTIPHTSWMMTGQIQKEFPDLFVKNTILRNVSEPRDIEKLAKAGFNYINLDRDLMRDHERLLRFKKAKEMFGVKLSLLANEHCIGGCIVMDEHYQFNNTRLGGPQYFADPISRISCAKWNYEDQAVPLKMANFPPWRADWQEFLDDYGIDVIKMHGRESKARLKETMRIIERYANGDEILFDNFQDFIDERNLTERPIDVWRKKIKTCKFDCWDCGYCDKIVTAKYGDRRNPRVMTVTRGLVEAVNNTVEIDIEGLTSPRVQSLLNYLGKQSKVYLEVGAGLGATAAAALSGNTYDNVYVVDNWKENIQPAEANFTLSDNTKESFLENIDIYVGKNKVTIFEEDLFNVDVTKIKNVDLFFYDGPHERSLVAKAVQHYAPCLAPGAILVFDDANWDDTILGANEGILKSGLKPVFERKVINQIESSNDWWNGLYLVVLE